MKEQSSKNAIHRKRILIIEDDHEYCELLCEAIRLHGYGHEILIEHDIDAALAFLQHVKNTSPTGLPRVILVDLTLTKTIGLMERLRGSSLRTLIPMIRLIPSDHPYDIRSCLGAEANSYVVKPDTFEELTSLTGDICRYWLRWNQCPILRS